MINFKEDKALKDYDSVSLAEILRAHFVENYPVKDTARLGDAIQVASYLHRNDVRRGARGKSVTPPYIEHPLRVAIRLFKYFEVTDSDIIIAAILHDTVEDHAPEFADFEYGTDRYNTLKPDWARTGALQFISYRFGYSVAAIVEDVSNPIMLGKPSKAEKISAYQQHVAATVSRSDKAFIVKLSDFVDNAGSLHHHYEYDDPNAQYFVNRYAPLIPLYHNVLASRTHSLFNEQKVWERLTEVEEHFKKFQTHA